MAVEALSLLVHTTQQLKAALEHAEAGGSDGALWGAQLLKLLEGGAAVIEQALQDDQSWISSSEEPRHDWVVKPVHRMVDTLSAASDAAYRRLLAHSWTVWLVGKHAKVVQKLQAELEQAYQQLQADLAALQRRRTRGDLHQAGGQEQAEALPRLCDLPKALLLQLAALRDACAPSPSPSTSRKVVTLVARLAVAGPRDKQAAAAELRSILVGGTFATANDITQAGGACALVRRLLSSSSSSSSMLSVTGREHAAIALCRLASARPLTQAAVRVTGGIRVLARLLDGSAGASVQADAAAAVNSLASGGTFHHVAIIEAGGVPALLQLLRNEDSGEASHEASDEASNRTRSSSSSRSSGTSSEAVQRCAAAALATLSTGSPHIARPAILAAGGIPALVQLLRTTSAPMVCREKAVQVLTSLARSYLRCKAAIVSAGGVTALACHMASVDTSRCLVLEEAASLLLSLAGTAGAVPALVQALSSGREVEQRGAAAALARVADGSPPVQAEIVLAGGVSALVRLCADRAACSEAEAGLMQQAASAALASLARGEPQGRAAVAAAPGGIAALVQALDHASENAQNAIAEALAALAGDGPAAQAAVAAAGGVPPLVRLLDSGSTAARRAAAAALACLAAGSIDNHAAIAAAGGIPALARLLGSGSAAVRRAGAAALRQLAGGGGGNTGRGPIQPNGGGGPMDAQSRSQAVSFLLGSKSTTVREHAAYCILADEARPLNLVAVRAAAIVLAGLALQPPPIPEPLLLQPPPLT